MLPPAILFDFGAFGSADLCLPADKNVGIVRAVRLKATSMSRSDPTMTLGIKHPVNEPQIRGFSHGARVPIVPIGWSEGANDTNGTAPQIKIEGWSGTKGGDGQTAGSVSFIVSQLLTFETRGLVGFAG